MNELELEVFRSGSYGAKGEWTDAMLDGLAEDYRTETHEAPVTLDHAQTGPALGWVAGVRRRGDRLIAHLKGLSEELLESLRRGEFKKRSVEIYGRLPETERPYLKAVSFLGAGTPAVKGLEDVVFGEDRGAVRFRDEAGVSEYFDFGDFDLAPDTSEKPIESTDDEERGPELNARSAIAFSELAEELRRSGRWMPSWERQGMSEFFAALSVLDEIEVLPGQAVHPSHWFGEFLRSLPPMLPLGEAAPRLRRKRDSIPRGDRVSASSVELHRRTVKLRESRPEMSYAEALLESAGG